MKKQDAINLYLSIRDLRSGQMEKETLVKYIKLRLALKKVADDFEVARQEISDQTKPKGWKEGDDTSKWEKAYQPVAQAWLDEEVDIDTHILSIDEAVELIANNDVAGGVGDFVVEQLVVKE